MTTVLVFGLAVAAVIAAIWYLTYWPLNSAPGGEADRHAQMREEVMFARWDYELAESGLDPLTVQRIVAEYEGGAR